MSVGAPETTGLLLDLSQASHGANALERATRQLQTGELPVRQGSAVSVNLGPLLMTHAGLTKLRQLIEGQGGHLHVLYAASPQTQQIALDMGLYVRRTLMPSDVLRQPLPLSQPQAEIEDAEFSKPADTLASAQKGFASRPEAPQATDVPAAEQPEQVAEIAADETPAKQQPEETQEEPSVLAQLLAEHEASVKAEQQAKAAETLASTPDATAAAKPAATFESETEYTLVTAEHDIDHPFAVRFAQGTTLIKQTLRSGQIVEAAGHLIVVGDVHAGAELRAAGDIVIWGDLLGIAHAGAAVGGAQANPKVEIRALRILALQLRIGTIIARQPDRLSRHRPIQGAATEAAYASELPPAAAEVARVVDGEIRIIGER